VQPSGQSSLILTTADSYIQIDKAGVGGNLATTVNDLGSSVEFSSSGQTRDGRPTTITATCTAITRD
jgi:hypothetical protein